MAARRSGVVSLGRVLAISAPASLGAVAALELLARSAPARVVASEHLLLAHDALLDHGHGLGLLLVSRRKRLTASFGGRRGGQRPCASRAVPARVGDAPGASGGPGSRESRHGRVSAARLLDVHLD